MRIFIYLLLIVSFIFGLIVLFKKIFYDRDTKQEIEKLEVQLGNAKGEKSSSDLTNQSQINVSQDRQTLQQDQRCSRIAGGATRFKKHLLAS